MKKIIKKILTTFCALALCVLCLTGCSWLQIDKAKYYNEVILTIGNKETNVKEFTKKDLVDAFSNYGYQYYQSYGYSLEESINKTIEKMIDRSLLMDVVVETIDNNDTYKFTDQEKLEIRKEVYDYMLDSLGTYETKVKTEWDMDVKIESEGEKTTLRTAEEEYTPTTIYNEDSQTVSRVEEEEEKIDVPSDLPEHFSKEYASITATNIQVFNEAWTRYIKALQDSAKSEGRSTNEKDVLLYEENRLIDLMINNTYLEKYEDLFFDNTPVNVEAVLKHYKEQYLSQYASYTQDASQYQTAMQSASSEYIYYHLDDLNSKSLSNKYVNVKHILINFSEQQKADITTLNTYYGITSDNTDENEEKKQNTQYQKELQRIVGKTTSTFEMSEDMYREYGARYNFRKVVGKENTYEAYASDIYEFVQDYANGINIKEQCKKFNDLVYIFNDDSGFMNSEFDYVVNLDTTIEDQMVKPFANCARALDEQGVGSMDMIISEYGYHIIMNTGRVENIVDASNIRTISDEDLLDILCTTTTTPESNKTIFNYIYDKLSLDDNLYDDMTSKVIENERHKLKVNNYKYTYYESRYKDLWD